MTDAHALKVWGVGKKSTFVIMSRYLLLYKKLHLFF